MKCGRVCLFCALSFALFVVFFRNNSKPTDSASRENTSSHVGSEPIATIYRQVAGRRIHTLVVNQPIPGDGTSKNAVTVVFLHGQAFNADTWRKIGTLNVLGQRGIHAVAVDLPGHGVTGGEPLPSAERGEFVKELLSTLGTKAHVVLVTPSMSGSYALPFLSSHAASITAWVPIAPVGLKGWAASGQLPSKDVTNKIKVVPMYGDQDPMRAEYAVLEDAFPSTTRLVLIRDARHPCYVDQPEVFHRELLSFLDQEVLVT